VILSVVLRLATVILTERTATLHELAAAAWTAAFVAFVVLYGPMLLWARKKT
jgi:uncharacterized protein involved in response to NO